MDTNEFILKLGNQFISIGSRAASKGTPTQRGFQAAFAKSVDSGDGSLIEKLQTIIQSLAGDRRFYKDCSRIFCRDLSVYLARFLANPLILRIRLFSSSVAA